MAIVKMEKVSCVMCDSTKEESLKRLRRLGVVHLEELKGHSARLTSLRENVTAAERAISVLDEAKATKRKAPPQAALTDDDAHGAPLQASLTNEDARDMVQKILSQSARRAALFDAINRAGAELARLSPWGEVDKEDFSALAKHGIFLYMYEIPSAKYSAVVEKTLLLSVKNKIARFLLVCDAPQETKPAGLPQEAFAVPLPEKSTRALKAEVIADEAELASLDDALLTETRYSDALQLYRRRLLSECEFENVLSGMHTSRERLPETAGSQGAANSAASGGERALAWLSGYVPAEAMREFKKECKRNKWAFVADDPTDEDATPTELKNNSFVSLIYPLTDFLGVLPGYNEYDISGWFLMFFLIFFAMIFGDGGYGLLICALGAGMMARGRKSGRARAPVNILVLLLGLCTVCWGTLTCTWFGIAAEQLPAWLRALSLAPISAAKLAARGLNAQAASDAASDNQKVFCFILAVTQLSIAHLKCAARHRKTLKALGDLGALMEVWGMFFVVLNLVVDSVRFPIPPAAIAVLGAGFALNFVFANYEGSIKESILASLKSIISVLLGIVNNFSDIVSYIRLWAVGLAGSAISSTVNEMASPMLGRLGVILFGIVLLVFGHGLNLVLNLLSVVVHGVRLNTLEFSQHLGVSWSGTKYAPFCER